jgi:3-oxoacyl-[acyl-carrier protein] reductase
LVLASSKGFGFACTKELYEEGANIIICSRSKQNLKKAKEDIEVSESLNIEARILPVLADLLHEIQINQLIEKTLKEFGRIDILIHNAGGPPSGPIDKISSEAWSNSINLNLLSFIRTTNVVIPIMK